MKPRNNFDMSSSGVNIDAVCYYDTVQAADNFRTFISEQSSDGNTLYIYGDEDNSILTIGDFCKFASHVKKQDLIDLAEELPDWDGDDYTMSELREMILKANPAMILNRYWTDYSAINIKPEYDLQRTVGYSQGDIAWVLIPSGDFDHGFVDHLFWDSPVYCRVEINGTDYYWDELFEIESDYLCEYDWDKEKMINYVCSNLRDGIDPEYVRKTLESILPETPDYD